MYFTKKERVVIILVVIIVALLSFYKIYDPKVKKEDQLSDEEVIEEADSIEEETGQELDKEIFVHISGSVNKPGILKIKDGSRLVEAIDLCGGLTDKACLDSINLAKKLVDEEKVYIPEIGEEIKGNNTLAKESQDGTDLVDINKSSKEELMTLPGIGDVTASKIIAHREDEAFSSIEDLKKVNGIGDKTFEDIKDKIIIE